MVDNCGLIVSPEEWSVDTIWKTNFYDMGPKIVSQTVKEEEATHIKGQADFA